MYVLWVWFLRFLIPRVVYLVGGAWPESGWFVDSSQNWIFQLFRQVFVLFQIFTQAPRLKHLQ